MQELISAVSTRLNLAEGEAEKAVGIMLSLVREHGNDSMVSELFEKLPGATELAEQYEDTPSAGGLLGMFGSAVGGPLAMLSRLKGAGLSLDDIKSLGMEFVSYSRENADGDLLKKVASSIPGLGRFLNG